MVPQRVTTRDLPVGYVAVGGIMLGQVSFFRVTCVFWLRKNFELGIVNTTNRGKDTFSERFGHL
jgi:hypothetical protein